MAPSPFDGRTSRRQNATNCTNAQRRLGHHVGWVNPGESWGQTQHSLGMPSIVLGLRLRLDPTYVVDLSLYSSASAALATLPMEERGSSARTAMPSMRWVRPRRSLA